MRLRDLVAVPVLLSLVLSAGVSGALTVSLVVKIGQQETTAEQAGTSVMVGVMFALTAVFLLLAGRILGRWVRLNAPLLLFHVCSCPVLVWLVPSLGERLIRVIEDGFYLTEPLSPARFQGSRRDAVRAAGDLRRAFLLGAPRVVPVYRVGEFTATRLMSGVPFNDVLLREVCEQGLTIDPEYMIAPAEHVPAVRVLVYLLRQAGQEGMAEKLSGVINISDGHELTGSLVWEVWACLVTSGVLHTAPALAFCQTLTLDESARLRELPLDEFSHLDKLPSSLHVSVMRALAQVPEKGSESRVCT